MENLKHTPGPWSISKVGNDYDQHIIYSEKETIVNTVYGEANAKLIAAAPELLEALMYAKQRIVLLEQYTEGKCDQSNIDKINKAINNATI